MTDHYLIDANVFIQAKNLHYNFDFCQGFWGWLREGFEQDVIFSIKKVRAELLAGTQGDQAREWALNMPSGFFLEDTSARNVMREYAHCMQWAHRIRTTPLPRSPDLRRRSVPMRFFLPMQGRMDTRL